jgi:hypothetical protein
MMEIALRSLMTFFWPTTLGLVSEQVPKGGALTISAMGMIAAGVLGLPFLGEPRLLLRFAALPLIMAGCYGGLFLYFRSRGGYRPVALGSGH